VVLRVVHNLGSPEITEPVSRCITTVLKKGGKKTQITALKTSNLTSETGQFFEVYNWTQQFFDSALIVFSPPSQYPDLAVLAL